MKILISIIVFLSVFVSHPLYAQSAFKNKGKRASLRFSKTMLHQSSGGAVGNIQDARINMEEWEKTNKILFDLLGKYCGKTSKRVAKDSERDNWLTAKEALDYGIIDEIVTTRK